MCLGWYPVTTTVRLAPELTQRGGYFAPYQFRDNRDGQRPKIAT